MGLSQYRDDVKLFSEMTAPAVAPVVPVAHAEGAEPEGADLEGASPEETVLLHRHDGTQAEVPGGSIAQFTVGRHHAAFSSSEVHRFRSHNQVLIRSLAARLSLFLRMEITLEQISLEEVDLHTYAHEFEPPRHMVMFKIHPLECMGVIDFSKVLGLSIADRMLGGKAFSVNPDRPIREIETALIDQIAHITMREWCGHWKFDEPLRASLAGHETNPNFLQLGGVEDTYYHIRIEASIGDCIDQIQMLMPVRSLDPLVRSLATESQVAEDEEDEEMMELDHYHMPWNHAYDNVKMRVAAEWNDLPIMTRDLVNLKEGDIIPLKPERLAEVELTLAGQQKFLCRLGSMENKCAVEIISRARH